MKRAQGHFVAVLCGLLSWTVLSCATVRAAAPLTSVTILGKNPIVVNARIDDRAAVSRLAVSDLQYITRTNGTIVRFVVGSDAMIVVPRVILQRPLIRDHRVRIPNGGIRHEPVVTLDVCIAGHDIHGLPFILMGQEGFTPPMVLDARDVPKNLAAQKKHSGVNHRLCQR